MTILSFEMLKRLKESHDMASKKLFYKGSKNCPKVIKRIKNDPKNESKRIGEDQKSGLTPI